MTEANAIKLFKCLADKSRLQILKSLMQEDMYVERLAERLGLTPATISFHLKKLAEIGAVTSEKTQYYTMYSLCRDTFSMTILDVLKEQSDEAELQAQRERHRVIHAGVTVDDNLSFFHLRHTVTPPETPWRSRPS